MIASWRIALDSRYSNKETCAQFNHQSSTIRIPAAYIFWSAKNTTIALKWLISELFPPRNQQKPFMFCPTFWLLTTKTLSNLPQWLWRFPSQQSPPRGPFQVGECRCIEVKSKAFHWEERHRALWWRFGWFLMVFGCFLVVVDGFWRFWWWFLDNMISIFWVKHHRL